MGRVIRIGAIYLAWAGLIASCDPSEVPPDALPDGETADAGPMEEPEDVPPLDRSGIDVRADRRVAPLGDRLERR